MKPDIIIIGPQGSGKSTQAQLLAEKIAAEVLSTGEIARELSKKDKETRLRIEAGQLAPEHLIRKEVKARLHLLLKKRIIFDGIPRMVSQAKWLDELLKSLNREAPILIYIHLSQEEAIARLLKRKICPKDEEIFYPRKKGYKENLCPTHKVKLVKRSDDSLESLKKRLFIFQRMIPKIKTYYQKQDRYIEIDGSFSIPKVASLIEKSLFERGLL